LLPATHLFSPAFLICQACLFINISSLFANCYRLTAMALLGRNKCDATMAVLVVVPINKRGNPFADLVW
jgi:hypothetical protein